MIRKPVFQPVAVGNYPAGSAPFNGTSRRVPLSKSARADGFTPGTAIAPQYINDELAEMTETMGVDIFGAMQDWKEYSPAKGSNNSVANCICGFKNSYSGAPVNWNQRSLLAAGANSTGKPIAFLSVNGDSPYTPQTAGSTTVNPLDIISNYGDHGIAIAMADSPSSFIEIFGTNGAWSSRANNTGGATINGLFAANSIWWALTSNGLYSNVTAGGATHHTDTAVAGMVWDFADAASNDDGLTLGTTICVAGRTVSGGNNRVATSTDGGASWSVGHDFGTHFISLTYMASKGLFVVWVDDGSIWTSPDGLAWTQVSNTATATSARGAVTAMKTFAACGPVIAKGWNLSPGVAGHSGVAWSDDLGLTWHIRAIGQNGIQQIKMIDGRLWACDGTYVYHSGRLEVDPTADM